MARADKQPSSYFYYCYCYCYFICIVLPLLPRTYLNPSTCALTMQSCHYRKTAKEAFLFLAQPMTWHCTGHLPLQRKCHRKIILKQRSLSRISNTPDEKQKKFPRNGRRIGLELGPVPTLFKSKMAGQLTWCNISVKSKLQHAPPGNPPGIWLFWKLLFKFPPTRAKMPFKCPTLGSIQVIKCPHPGDISQAQKWQKDGGNTFSCRTKYL